MTRDLTCPDHDHDHEGEPLYYVKYATQEDAKIQTTEQLYVNDRPVFYCLKMHFFNYYWEENKLVPLGYKEEIFKEQ